MMSMIMMMMMLLNQQVAPVDEYVILYCII